MTEVNRKGWPAGPWDHEPDRVEPFEHAGLLCFLRRHQRGGYWNGYVGLPRTHPLHGWHYEAFNDLPPMLDDHRRLSYSGSGSEFWPPDLPRPDLHFVGFCCGETWDLSPTMFAFLTEYAGALQADPTLQPIIPFPDVRICDSPVPYRTLEYARAQVEQLAELLAQIAARRRARTVS